MDGVDIISVVDVLGILDGGCGSCWWTDAVVSSECVVDMAGFENNTATSDGELLERWYPRDAVVEQGVAAVDGDVPNTDVA
jgi:hypothetical protein